ncbi:MAG: collagenase [Lentisphaerae bacterium GWF2_44_16]|nr:MAG: collagenase [Lentisphaerae bacterium GWF2_44_16]
MNKVEICSPAGSYESLAAALKAGADSVYFGIGHLNMRARSSVNFTIADLKKIRGISEKNGVKNYLVLNSVLYDNELPLMKKICDAAKSAGIHAVVAGDMAAIDYASSIGLSVHISVQANVCNSEAVRLYSRYANVMVLARELPLAGIKKITNFIRKNKITGPSGNLVRIEIFAHGALCVSISGKCYMSLAVYNSSANRGECYQNCRRKYLVSDAETGEQLVIDNKYVMSPKDICTLPFLDSIIDADVSILKIEGRGRSPDYVYAVTRAYREAVESCRDGSFSPAKSQMWMKELSSVFNRGFWGGYYLGEKLDAWCGTGGNLSPKRKIHIGKVLNYYQKSGVADFALEAGGLKKGDEIMVCGTTTGVASQIVDSLMFNGEFVETAPKGSTVSVSFQEKLRKGDKLYLVTPRKFGESPED